MGWLRGVEEMGGLVMGDVRWRSGSWFCASMGRWADGLLGSLYLACSGIVGM